jgi:hypothetical protein
MLTRREIIQLPLAAPVVVFAKPGRIDSTVNGVKLGAQTYSFRDMPLDAAIQAM